MMIDIYGKRHVAEYALQRPIDLETQYVRLKLLTNERLAIMQRDSLERPDVYQSGLRGHNEKEIQDEDLIKTGAFGRFVLIRGQAGIVKTTLV